MFKIWCLVVPTLMSFLSPPNMMSSVLPATRLYRIDSCGASLPEHTVGKDYISDHPAVQDRLLRCITPCTHSRIGLPVPYNSDDQAVQDRLLRCITPCTLSRNSVMRIRLNYYTDPDPGSGNPPYKSGCGSKEKTHKIQF